MKIRWIQVMLVLVVVMAIAGCGRRRGGGAGPPKQMTLQELVMRDGMGMPTPQQLYQYGALVTSIASKTTSTEQEVIDGTARIRDELNKKHGIWAPHANILQGVNASIPAGAEQKSFDEWARSWMADVIK